MSESNIKLTRAVIKAKLREARKLSGVGHLKWEASVQHGNPCPQQCSGLTGPDEDLGDFAPWDWAISNIQPGEEADFYCYSTGEYGELETNCTMRLSESGEVFFFETSSPIYQVVDGQKKAREDLNHRFERREVCEARKRLIAEQGWALLPGSPELGTAPGDDREAFEVVTSEGLPPEPYLVWENAEGFVLYVENPETHEARVVARFCLNGDRHWELTQALDAQRRARTELLNQLLKEAGEIADKRVSDGLWEEGKQEVHTLSVEGYTVKLCCEGGTSPHVIRATLCKVGQGRLWGGGPDTISLRPRKLPEKRTPVNAKVGTVSTPADTYIAVTEAYWTHATPEGDLVANRVYEAISAQVGGFPGIWQIIEEFSNALEGAFEWDEVEFIDTVDKYVPAWQNLILTEGCPVTFADVHRALSTGDIE